MLRKASGAFLRNLEGKPSQSWVQSCIWAKEHGQKLARAMVVRTTDFINNQTKSVLTTVGLVDDALNQVKVALNFNCCWISSSWD